MELLNQIRCNILYLKKDKANESDLDEFTKYNEFVLLSEKPTYIMNNQKEIVKQTEIVESRFIIANSAIDRLIEQLEIYKKAEPEDLK